MCYKCKKVGHLSRDCREHPDDSASQCHANDLDKDGNSLPSEDALSEIDRIPMEEDDIHEIGDEEKGKLNDVDYLTGNPLTSDILFYAVPVCGPYSALQSYKYRVKIVPGTAKKGKGSSLYFILGLKNATRKILITVQFHIAFRLMSPLKAYSKQPSKL